jgi:Fur family zinc uptake transcriptional regulator
MGHQFEPPGMACSHRTKGELADNAVERRLAEASDHCARVGQTWTPGRARIYDLLVRAERPIGAYELLQALSRPSYAAKPPTVYRALEFLVRVGLAHRIESLNAFVACDGHHGRSAIEFLICDCCGRAQECELEIDQTAFAAASARGFKPNRLVLEVHGVCPDCVG